MQKFDYIVVGAGSAGCVVASRLSEDPSVRVLLLDAGPPATGFWVRTPAGMAKLFKHQRYNWGYFTEPVPTLNDRRLYWPRGKALGGSSAINGMVYVRGNRGDFDHWETEGNPGWGWEGVLPFFKRLENYGTLAQPEHGTSGPVTITDPAVKHPTAADFIRAAGRIGIPEVKTFVGTEPEGVGFLQANIRNGVRQSSYETYIKPHLSRSNLVVESGAHVRRILLKDRRAMGVEIIQNVQLRSFEAIREVVVSGGALNSPQILMLSGIGAGAQLSRHGIETLVDLPGVGKNLQDHFVARFQARVTPESSYNRELHGWRRYREGIRYLTTGGGYLALASSMAAAFVKSRPDVDFPDLEISFRPMTFTHHPSGRVDIDDFDGISASVYQTRPESRGEVMLKSNDPMDAPAFAPNYLADPRDVEVMVAGMRKLRAILAAEPLSRRIIEELSPGMAVSTDEDMVDYMRRDGHCAFHPAGSCRMGPDRDAVVDARLRVHGVEGLRVADASIMPTVTSGNTNSPSMMIGEKAADLIKADARG